jgi:hypothetical protein
MSYARVTYSISGTQYAVPFDYIDADYVHAYLIDSNDAETEAAFTWVSSSLINITDSMTGFVDVKIVRETPITSKLVDFQDASLLTEEDLDNAFQQIFDNAQETRDIAEDQAGVTQAEVDATLTECEAARDAALVAETNAETAEANAELAESNAEAAAISAAASASASQTEWRYGSGVPSGALGINGDNYTNTDNYDIYHKETGAWVLKGNIKGIDGTGAGDFVGPASSTDDNFVSFNGATGKAGKDSGKKASDFATSGHNHSGTYEPADASILKSAAIGSTVQAFDADTVKKDVAQVFSAQQTVAIGSISSSSGTCTWDVAAAQEATITLTENITGWTLSNLVTGTYYSLIVTQHASAAKTIAWDSSKFKGLTGYTMSSGTGKIDHLVFVAASTSVLRLVGYRQDIGA